MNTDVLLLSMSDISRDARTLNLARALKSNGVSVVVGANCSSSTISSELNVMHWPDPGGKALNRWQHFHAWAKQLDVQPRVVAAMDFFALRAAVRISKQNKSKLIYDMREFYFALGPLGGRGIRQQVIAFLERRYLKHCNKVIVAGRLDARIVEKHFELSEPATVVLNTPPYRDKVNSNVLRDNFNIPSDHIVVIYQGVVHHGRGLIPFFKAMAILPDVQLCIVGDGPATNELKDFAESTLVGNRVHWKSSVPYDELHNITCSADIGLCLIEPVSMSYEYALPNKLFEYMMARIPSLVSDLPGMHDQILQTPVGMLVDRNLNENDIVASMDALRIPATREAMIKACDAMYGLAYEGQARHAVDLFKGYLH